MDSYLKNKKVNIRFTEDIEPQEILLDSLAQRKEADIGFSERRFEVPLSKRTLHIFLISIVVLFVLFFLKTFQLQVVENKSFLAQAEGNKFIIYQLQASRGVIYDRNFEQLVFNQPGFDLICRKANLPQSEVDMGKILNEISQIIKTNPEELRKKIEESDSSLISVAENLDHQTLIVLETKIEDFPGFEILNQTVREYKDGPIFAHLVGYTGKIKSDELKEAPEFYSILDYVGRDGLEKSYESALRKNPGKLQIERDVKGKEISREVISLPEPGKSLVLWLDAELQRKLVEELGKELKNVNSKKGIAIAMDPKTGGILAMVSLPNFDNNLFSPGADSKALKDLLENPLHPLFNRVISGTYPTGSTIKPLVASGALEERIISPQKEINCQGAIQVVSKYNPEIVYTYNDWKVHGKTDLRKAIAESCDVYFYTIGGGYGNQTGLGPTLIKKYLQLFGWGEKTKIDLPGEAEGLVPDPSWKKEVKGESWWDGDTYHFSIGQGDLSITPLQVVTAFSAIANGGKLIRPQIVQKIIDSSFYSSDKPDSLQVIEEFKPEVIRENFIAPENLQIVREGMREAVTYGSSVTLNDLPVKAAAKSGTAETSKKEVYHSWVTVFAPYDDPQIVLTIMLEDVQGMQPAATRVAKSVLEWYFTK